MLKYLLLKNLQHILIQMFMKPLILIPGEATQELLAIYNSQQSVSRASLSPTYHHNMQSQKIKNSLKLILSYIQGQ